MATSTIKPMQVFKIVELTGTTDTSGNMSPACSDYDNYRPVCATVADHATQMAQIYARAAAPIYGYHLTTVSSTYTVVPNQTTTLIVLLVRK